MNRIIPIIVALVLLSAIIRHVGFFPVIVLFIIGISIYSQYKKAAGKTDGKTPQWKKSLDDILGQIRKEMEAGPDHAQKAAQTEWERLAAGQEPEIEPLDLEFDMEEPVRSDSGTGEEISSLIARQEPAVADRLKPVTVGDKTETPAPAPAIQASRLDELRKAVVWSEILAKPLALRGRQR